MEKRIGDACGEKAIYLSSPHMSDEGYEKAFIEEHLPQIDSPLGPNVDAFEKELAEKRV